MFLPSPVGTSLVSVCLSYLPPAAYLTKEPGTIFSTWQRRRGQAAVRSPLAVSPNTDVAPVHPCTVVPRLYVVSRCGLRSMAGPDPEKLLVQLLPGSSFQPTTPQTKVVIAFPTDWFPRYSPGLICPRGGTRHLSWLHVRRSPLAYVSCLSRSLWVAALPSRTLLGLSSLASPINWMRVHSASSPGSVIKTLKKTSPGINPCSTSLLPASSLYLCIL